MLSLLCAPSRTAKCITRIPSRVQCVGSITHAGIAYRAIATAAPQWQSGYTTGEEDTPPAPGFGTSQNYVNLLEDDDGSISINSVSIPDQSAPPGSKERKSFITLSTGVATDQPLIILNNGVFLWRPPLLNPTAVLKNTIASRMRQSPRSDGAPNAPPNQSSPLLPGGWEGWLDKETGQDEIWKLFEIVTPKPDILIFGTGYRSLPLPQPIRSYLANLGMQVDVQDSRNAASTFNLLKSEGRRVACALLPPGVPDA